MHGGRDVDGARVFVCYAHEDEHLLKELVASLGVAKWGSKAVLDLWYDEAIEPGAEWRREIETRLATSDIFVVLLSKWLLYSDFVREVEFPRIQDRWARDECSVVIVPTTQLTLDETPFSNIQMVLEKPLTGYVRRDDAWPRVTRAVLDEAKKRRGRIAEQVSTARADREQGVADVIPLRRRSRRRDGGPPSEPDAMSGIRNAIEAMPRHGDPGWASFQMRLGPVIPVLDGAIRSASLEPWAHEQVMVLRSALSRLLSPATKPADRARAMAAAQTAADGLRANTGTLP